LSQLFGGKTPMEKRFAGGEWSSLETGAPILKGALASFDCRVRAIHDGSTHDIIICDVVDTAVGEGEEALLYFKRAYRTL